MIPLDARLGEPRPATGAPPSGTTAGGALAVVAAVAGGGAISEFLVVVTGASRAPGMPTGGGVLVAASAVASLAAAGSRHLARVGRRRAADSWMSVAELSAEYGGQAALDATAAALAEALGRARATSAVPLAIHMSDDVIEVFWDRPPPIETSTFRLAPNGWVWTTTAAALLAHLPVDGVAVLPALVLAGATGLGELYLNLEGCRLVNLVGEPAEVSRAMAHLVAGVSRRSVDVMVVANTDAAPTVGDPGENASLDLALVEARRRRAQVRRHLDDQSAASLIAVRARDRTEAIWRPLLIAVPEASSNVETLGRLMRAARGERSGVAGVFANQTSLEAEAVTITCHDGALSVAFLDGVAVVLPDTPETPAQIGSDDHDDEPLADAPPPPPPPPLTPPPTEAPVRVEVAAEPTEESGQEGVEVRMLGPIEISGMRSMLGGKGVELIAYLACHRAGVSDDRIRTVLWPERAVTRQTWLNRVSASRHALGRDPDGELLLPHFEDGIGKLAASVRTDVELLDAALRRARDSGDAEGLRVALGRVRGRPFEERAGYEWAFAEFHVAHAERLACEAAEHLVEVALADGDWKLALWAAEQGMVAVPGSEQLACARMRAFAAGADLRGVHRAYRDLLASLGGDEAETSLHPDTLSLYHELCTPSQVTTGWRTGTSSGR